MYKYFPLSALALACAAPQATLANDRLEEVIVISSRVEMPLRQLGTSVSVITAEDIRQQGHNSLADVLRTQPSVALSNSGGAGKATSLRIRGEEGYRTRMFLDGIDISDVSGTQSGPKVEHLLSAGIGRVEILRGPQGLMYGADAGGIVNITTLSPSDGLSGDVSAEGGRYGTSQLGANLAGGNGTVDFTLSAADFETDGFNAKDTDLVLRDDDGYENTTLHGKFGWNASEALRFELVARDTDTENEYDDCFGPVGSTDDCSDTYKQEAWRVSGAYNTVAFTNTLAYDTNTTERAFTEEGVTSYETEGELERVSYVGSYTYAEALRLVYGFDLESGSVDDGSTARERDQDGYFLEYQGGFNDRFFVTAGLRYDDNEDFGTHTSYRVSGAYLFDVANGELKLKGTYGTGFRAPSLSEIAYNGGSYAYPPASEVELKEEESEGYDIGLSWFSDGGTVLEAVYFDQRISDEIYFDLVNFSGYLQDTGESKSRGIELIGDVPIGESLSLTANYTYNDTETVDGSLRVRRPKNLVNLGLTWQTFSDRLTLGLMVRGAYDAEDIDGRAIDDYEVVDINARFRVWRGLEVFGRVDNLLDEDYQEVPGYNTSGAAAYAGLRYSF